MRFEIKGETTSFTPEQKIEVDKAVLEAFNAAATIINRSALRIKKMDKRPKQTYSEAEPDVFFPYVAQATLEDFILFCQSRV